MTIIPFKKKDRLDKNLMRILKTADQFDDVINEGIRDGLEPAAICGVMANRLVTAIVNEQQRTETNDLMNKIIEIMTKEMMRKL